MTAQVQLGDQQCCFCWHRPSVPRAHQQLLSSQTLLNFTKSPSAAARERAVGRIGMLSYLLASWSSLEVRSQALCSQAVSPSPHARAGWGCL